jgi:hypothetical protein
MTQSRLSDQTNRLTAGPRLNFCKHSNDFSRKACINFGEAYGLSAGTPDLGVGGEDYRANSVHAPFPEHLSTPSIPSRSKARASNLRTM